MPLSTFYWLLMVLSFLGSGYLGIWGPAEGRWFGGWAFIAFLLFFLLGLKVFGPVLTR